MEARSRNRGELRGTGHDAPGAGEDRGEVVRVERLERLTLRLVIGQRCEPLSRVVGDDACLEQLLRGELSESDESLDRIAKLTDVARPRMGDEDGEDLKPRERYFSELVYPEATSNSYRQAPGKFRAELHERFSNPLYPIAFSLIALAAVGQAHSTRQNRVQQVAVAFVVAAMLRLGGLALNNIVVIDAAATPLLYALPLSGMLGVLLGGGWVTALLTCASLAFGSDDDGRPNHDAAAELWFYGALALVPLVALTFLAQRGWRRRLSFTLDGWEETVSPELFDGDAWRDVKVMVDAAQPEAVDDVFDTCRFQAGDRHPIAPWSFPPISSPGKARRQQRRRQT